MADVALESLKKMILASLARNGPMEAKKIASHVEETLGKVEVAIEVLRADKKVEVAKVEGGGKKMWKIKETAPGRPG